MAEVSSLIEEVGDDGDIIDVARELGDAMSAGLTSWVVTLETESVQGFRSVDSNVGVPIRRGRGLDLNKEGAVINMPRWSHS